MYLPIPEATNRTHSVTAYTAETECEPSFTVTATASFSKPQSTVPLTKMSDVDIYEVNRPIDGKWHEIKESGSIKMTPMSIKKEKHTYFVAGLRRPFIDHCFAKTARPARKINGTCVNCISNDNYVIKLAIVEGSYVEQGDLSYWKTKYPHAPHIGVQTVLDSSKIEAAKAQVYSDLFQQWNLGEELVELRETISGVSKLTKEAVSLILNARKTINGLLERGLKKEAANRWMEFRYGIMPIIYSIQDIVALKGATGLYRTSRSAVYPDEVSSSEAPSGAYFEDVGSSILKCSVTAKARWASQEMKQLDLININPLTTALEVYPWAMVVRWFFNVSTFINSRIKSLTSLALEHHACVAIREKMEYGTYLNVHEGYHKHIFDVGDSPTCGKGFWGYYDFGIHSDFTPQRVLLSWISKDNYTRYLYQPSDVKLVFNPHISWQRSVDGVILGWGQLSKLLRRLK